MCFIWLILHHWLGPKQGRDPVALPIRPADSSVLYLLQNILTHILWPCKSDCPPPKKKFNAICCSFFFFLDLGLYQLHTQLKMLSNQWHKIQKQQHYIVNSLFPSRDIYWPSKVSTILSSEDRDMRKIPAIMRECKNRGRYKHIINKQI